MKKLVYLIKNCEACKDGNLTNELDENTKKLKYFCTRYNEFIPDQNEIAPFCKLEDDNQN